MHDSDIFCVPFAQTSASEPLYLSPGENSARKIQAGNADGWFVAHGGQILKIGFKRSQRHIVPALAQLRD